MYMLLSNDSIVRPIFVDVNHTHKQKQLHVAPS